MIQYVVKKTAKDSAEIFVYYVGDGAAISRYFAKVYNFVFQQLKPLVLARSKTLSLKKITGDDAKKIKRLPEIQALTKDFTSYKIR